ncbi:MAG: DUF5011 domain-containing protein [Firmicutes bacterium]|nr:DUF5011 domain-containing protein [Bacillota bacterium]
MKRKGFTLIETLGVILLLGIIASIVFVVVDKTIDNSKEKLYEEQLNQIKGSLKDLAYANIFLMPDNEEYISITLGQLKQMGYANKEIKNPKNDMCFSNDTILTITKENTGYKYDILDITDVECDTLKNNPIIKLNGSFVEYLEIGDTYVDASFTALSSTNEDISSNVEVVISGDGNTINTSTKSKYTITYSVTDDFKTTKVIRTIFVK